MKAKFYRSMTGVQSPTLALNPTTTRRARKRRPLFGALLSALIGAVLPTALAADWAWNTAPGSGNFNDANWTSGTIPGAGTGTPASADSLYFGASSQQLLTNDFTGFTFTGLFFNSDANAFTIGGNAITLGSNIVNSSASLQTLDLDLALSAARTITTAPGGGNIVVGGNISGAFVLTNDGAGVLTLSGANTYAGGTLNGGTLNYSGSLNAAAANVTVNSRLNVSGTLNISNLWIGHLTGGAGAVYQTGGNVTLNQTAGTDNFRIGSGTNGYGYYNLSGGTLNVAQANVTSAGTRGNNTVGVLDITGGSVTSSDRFAVGTGSTAGRGVATVSGGTLNFSTTANGLSLIANGANAVGSGVTGILNVGGGATAAQVIGPSTATASRGLILAGVNITNSLAVANLLPNGSLTVNGISVTQPGPVAHLNFNGGTLKATALNLGASFLASANLDAVNVLANGGAIDNNGTAITIAAPLRAPAGHGIGGIASFTGGAGYIGAPFVSVVNGSGDITGVGATAIAQIDSSPGNATSGQVTNIVITSPGIGYTATPTFVLSGGGATIAATITGAAPTANTSGGLTFIGSGKTTLSGASTYTGITTVNAGTLALSGSGAIANSSAIVLATGATLDVSAASPTYALSAGQVLSNSASTAWIKGNLDASAGRLALNFSGSPVFTVTNGTLTLSPNTVVQINNTGAPLAAGSYLLVSRATTGNIGQVVGAVTVPVTVLGGGASGNAWLQISGSELYLNVTSSQVVSTLDSSSNPSGYLDPVTFSFHITDFLPTPVATGDVTFVINGVPFSTNAVAGGIATSPSIASLSRSSSHLITAFYSGDANHPALTNTLVQSVTNHPPVAGQVSFQRVTNDNTIVIPISQLLATASDADGDLVSFAGVGASIRGITPTINGGSLVYSNPKNVNDVIPFYVSDALGDIGTGQIIIQRHLLPGQVAKHNILLLIADDLGSDSLALFNSTNTGASLPPTPNLDALGRRGVVFPRFHGRPSCSQFRAALITGQHSFRNDVGVAIGSVPLRTNFYTLPRAFTTNAPEYALASFGKYHLSPNNDLNGPWTTAGWTNYAGYFSPGVANYTNWTKISNGVSANVTNYATTDQVNDTISFIQSQGTNRWFAWVAFAAPHSPYHKPPVHLAPHYAGLSGAATDISTNTRPYFEAMTEALDTEIGRLLTFVDTNDTDIIFVADNGSPISVQQPPYKTAAVAETVTGNGHAKFTLYEGGVAAPLFITGPSVVNGGRTNHTTVDTVDLWQTIQELAGIDVPASKPAHVITDSKSIVPALKADVIVPQPYLLGEQFNQNANSDGVSLRNERFKLIHWYNRTERFYDLQNDPYEFTNLLTAPLPAVAQSNFNALKIKLAEYFTLPNNKNTRNLVPWPVVNNVVYSNGTFVVNAQFTQLSTNLFAANPNQDDLTRYRDGGTNLNYQVILWRSSVLNDPLAWTPVATNIVNSVTGNTFVPANGAVADLNANADHYFYRLTPYFQ